MPVILIVIVIMQSLDTFFLLFTYLFVELLLTNLCSAIVLSLEADFCLFYTMHMVITQPARYLSFNSCLR